MVHGHRKTPYSKLNQGDALPLGETRRLPFVLQSPGLGLRPLAAGLMSRGFLSAGLRLLGLML
jgi:hypothetical protein